MNRLKAPNLYGRTIRDVCQKPGQFSCWNLNDPNRILLLQAEIYDPLFTVCCEVATKVFHANWPDLTKGSDHYHAISLSTVPYWARRQTPKIRVGQHLFYQLNKGG